ncbi:AraC family transcriptional regulator [Paenibacillus sp. PL91]|uniref:AraC family transcriptional regulator n=1 Tax=Paenibacillus sp. PL91 TaxID=2729538 RepID=UPI001CB8BF0F|nr:AraC family transcriptional regulator [Paenibacillus sp. PL91]
MFLKRVPVKRKGVSCYYYKVVESYRDELGKPKHRLISNLGVLTDAEADEVRLQLRLDKDAWLTQRRAVVINAAEADHMLNRPRRMSKKTETSNPKTERHGRQKQPIAQPWLDSALEFIRDNYRDPITRKQLAALSGVSIEHFSREFRRHTGKTFKAYLTELRIRAAQEELLSSKSGLVDIALNVGYKDGFYLSRKFKQVVGTAPMFYIKRPKKIASLTYNYSASLLALGVMPSIAVVSGWASNHFRNVEKEQPQQWFGNVPVRISDAISPYKPDLIFDYRISEEQTAALRAIAPLISLPFEQMDWDEQFRFIADVVGKGGEASECLNRLEGLIEQANRKLDQKMGTRGTAVVVELGMDKCYVFGERWGRGTHVLYDQLQFAPPQSLLQDGSCRVGYVEMSIESVPTYAADHLFFALPPCVDERAKVLAAMNTESWNRIEAVKNKQAYSIDGESFYGFDPASTQKQLLDIVTLLTRT